MSLNIDELSSYLDPSSTKPKSTDLTFEQVAKQHQQVMDHIGTAPSIGGRGGTRFDTYMTQQSDQDELRGQLQSGGEKLRRGALSRGASILPKFVQMLGHVGGFVLDAGSLSYDLAQGAMKGEMPTISELFKHTFDNALVREMNEMDEGFNDNVLGIDTKVFSTKQHTEGSLWEQLGTAEFWAKDAFDGVAFLASAIIPGGILGKAFKGAALLNSSRMSKALSTELKAIKGGSKAKLARLERVIATRTLGDGTQITAQQAAQLQNYIGQINNLTVNATTAYNTIGEAGFEAFETGKQLRNDLALKRYSTAYENLPDMLKEEIRTLVAPRQAETFAMNAAVLAGPNYIQSRFFFGKPQNASAKVKQAMKSGNMKIEDLTKHMNKHYVGTLKGNVAKSVLTGIASEGFWEEGVQTAIQTYEERKANGDVTGTWADGVMDSYLDNLTTTDGQKAIFLGGLLGSLGGLTGGLRNWRGKQLESKGAVDGYTSRLNYLQGVRDSYIKNVNSIHNGVDADGNPIYDDQALMKIAANGMRDITKFTEATVAALKGDNLHASYINREALAELAYERFSDSYFETLEEAEEAVLNDLKAIAAMDNSDPYVKQQVEGILPEQVKTLRQIYETVQNSISPAEEIVLTQNSELGFLELIRTNLFHQHMKADFFRNVGDIKDKEGAEAVVREAEERIAELTERDSRTQLLADYVKFLNKNDDVDQVLNNDKATAEEKAAAQYEKNKREFLWGENAAQSAYFPGSQTIEQKAGRKIPEGSKMYATLAMQRLTKNEINQVLDQLQTDPAAIDTLSTLVTSKLEFITPDVAASINEKIKPLTDQIEDLEIRVNEINSSFFDPETDASERTALKGELEQIDLKLKPLKAIQALGETLDKTSKADMDFVGHMKARFESGNREEVEEALYASNFTDKNGTSVLGLAAKTIAELRKKDTETRTGDLKEIANTLKELEAQIELFEQEGFRELAENEEFNNDTKLLLSRNLAHIADQIEVKDKYLDTLRHIHAMLQIVEKDVRANQGNRMKVQEETEKVYSRIRFAGLGIDSEGKVQSTEIYDLLTGVIGKSTVDAIIAEAKTDGMNSSYAEVILQLFKKNASTDQKTKLQNALLAQLTAMKPELVAVSRNMQEDLVNKYLENPEGRILSNMLYLPIEGGKANSIYYDTENPLSGYYKFNKSKNLYDLIRYGENDPTLTQENRDRLKKLIVLHEKAIGTNQALRTLQSEADFGELISKTKSAKELEDDKQYTPTYQQVTAIRAMYTFVHSLITGDMLEDFAFLAGEGGTGKTSVILKTLLHVLGYDPKLIITTATNPNAAQTLKESTGLDSLSFTAITEESLKGKRLLIVDEAAAMDDAQFNKLTETVKKYNEGKAVKERVKVIMTGDPNQISADSFIPPVSKYAGANGTITQIPPLTVVYRTDVNAITDFADAFKDKNEYIQGVYATSNSDVGADTLTKDTMGVQTGSRDNIISFSSKLVKEGAKSIAVIVDSEESKALYQGKVNPAVEVLTYVEAQGRSIDKVFIDINRQKLLRNNQSATQDMVVNKIMYTSVSRARTYVYIVNYDNSFTQVIDKGIKENKEARGEDLEKNAKWYDKQINRDRDLAERYLGKEIKKEEPKKEEPEPEEIEDEEENLIVDETDPDGKERDKAKERASKPVTAHKQVPPVDTDNQHSLAFPETDFAAAELKEGGKVQYVKEEEGNQWKAVVYGETHSGNYTKLGEVAKEEVKTLPEALRKAFEQVEGIVSMPQQLFSGQVDKQLIEDNSLFEGVLSFAQDIKYNYEGNSTSQNLISSVINLWKSTFMPAQGKEFEFRLQVFNVTDLKELRKSRTDLNHMLPGVPYLIIQPKGKGKIQYVEMQSAYINENTPNVKELKEFREAVKQLNEVYPDLKYGDHLLNKAIRYFHYNFKQEGKSVVFDKNTVTLENIQKILPQTTQEQFEKLQQIANTVIPNFYGVRTLPKKITVEDFNENYKENTDVEYDLRNIKKGKGRLYVKEKGETKFKAVREEGISAGLGKAQYMLKDIAKRHIDFKFMGGIPLENAGKVHSLLAESDSVERAFFRYIRNAYHEQEISKLDKHASDYDNLVKSIKAIKGEDVLKAMTDAGGYDAVIAQARAESAKFATNITIEMLDEILTFDPTGRHLEIQTQLPIRDFNHKGTDLESNAAHFDTVLSTAFSGVTPAAIIVDIPPVVSQSNQTAPQQEAPVEPQGVANNEGDFKPDGFDLGDIFNNDTPANNTGTPDVMQDIFGSPETQDIINEMQANNEICL